MKRTLAINGPFRTTLACVLVGVLATVTTSPAQATSDGEAATNLPAECRAAIDSGRAELVALGDELTFSVGIEIINAEVAPACGLDLEAGTSTTDPAEIAEYIVSLDPEGPRMTSPSGPNPTQGIPHREQGGVGLPLGGATGTHPCSLPGMGGGTLSVRLLGISLPGGSASGSWAPQSGLTEVTGARIDGYPFTGTQTGSAGVLETVLPTTGGSTGVCAYVTEEVDGHYDCLNLIVYQSCNWVFRAVQKEVVCGATAYQDLLAVVHADHAYNVASAPPECNG